MKILRSLMLMLAVGAAASVHAQAPAAVTPMFQPAIDDLLRVTGNLQVDRWKLSGENRAQVAGYIASINKDLTATLPDLLQQADASQAEASRVLAVSRNVDALYDVLLRVAATSEVAAPQSTSAEIEQAVLKLRDARQTLDDRIQRGVAAQTSRVADLQAQLRKAQADLAAAATPVCPSAPPKKSAKKK